MPLEDIVGTVTSDPVLLLVVFGYAVLVAALVPLPTEGVLLVSLVVSLPWYLAFPLVIVVASLGSAIGSLVALRIGYGVSHSGLVTRLLERSTLYTHFRERSLVDFVRRYSYVGMAVVVALPMMPESTTFYAFSVLAERPLYFALSAFLGTVVRLHFVLLLAGGTLHVAT